MQGAAKNNKNLAHFSQIPEADLHLDYRGFVVCRVKVDRVNLESMKRIFDSIYKVSNTTENICVLLDARKHHIVESEARKFMTTLTRVKSLTVLVNSILMRTTANVITYFNDLPFKVYISNSFEDAAEWLKLQGAVAVPFCIPKYPWGTMSVLNNGVMHLKYHKGVHVNEVIANEGYEICFDMINQGARPYLISDTSEIKSVSPKAKSVLLNPEKIRKFKAIASIGNHPVSTAMINFIIGIYKDLRHIRIFSSFDEAMEWITNLDQDTEHRASKNEGMYRDIFDQIAKYSIKDFSYKIPVTKVKSPLDELAVGLNMLGEELETTLTDINIQQNQMIQAAKLASLGEMSAGIAHELNNPLFIVSGFLNKIEKKLKKDHPEAFKDLEQLLIESQNGTQRMKKIIMHMRDYSRISPDQCNELPIHQSIERSLTIFAEQFKSHNIQVSKEFTPTQLSVIGDQIQLEQVFTNLFTNARDAIIEKNGEEGGLIIVRSKASDNQVLIEVTDNGIGIEDEKCSKVFDPFYTTKEIGKGTGLGMSVSYGIIKKHNGSISVHSKPKRGSTFSIKLPRFIKKNALVLKLKPSRKPRKPFSVFLNQL